MMIQNANIPFIFRPQNQGLQQIVAKLNANAQAKQNFDVVNLSKKTQEILEKQSKIEKDTTYQKYPVDMFTKEEWAEKSVLEQRNGIQTVLDVIEHAKSKLEHTMSKMDELQNYLDGATTHSDINMTKELAEAYLHNYKQSIQTDYTTTIKQHIGTHNYFSNEYDVLSGGLASDIDVLNSISGSSLELKNLSSDPEGIMKALDNASNILKDKMSALEDDFKELTGKDGFTEPAISRSIFDGNSNLSFFKSQVESPYKLASVNGIFNGQSLNLWLDN